MEMSFSDLTSSALRILPSPYAKGAYQQYTGSREFSEENRNESEHYLHQPLPPPPPPQDKLPEPPTKYQRVSPAIAPLTIPLTPVSDGKESHGLGIPAHLMELSASDTNGSFESDPSYLAVLR
ncbi:hypothetical protein LPJ56_000978 [Coemansia sp. RSA 2599]|nr:hypothetical protein LPJ56_000978 [Coemansia sp. RSA 2599]